MALGMRLGDVTAVDAVHVYAQAPAAAKVEHQGGTALEDEGAAGTGQGFQQGEGTDDLFYKYGVGGVVIGRRFFLSILGCGFRVVSFFYLLQDGIDCFCTVPPASVAEEGFTADGISVKCGSIDGISLRAGEGVEGIVTEDIDEYFFKGGHRDTVRDFDGLFRIFVVAMEVKGR